jgi:hypothetical protein
VFIQRPDAEIMCVAARNFNASLSTRRKIVQIQDVHAANADRMDIDRALRPLLAEPPRSSSLTPPKTSREELQTTPHDCPWYEGRDFRHDTWCLNIRECAPRLFLFFLPF